MLRMSAARVWLPPQASSVALEVDWLHYSVISVTMLGSTAVFAVATWWLIRFRRFVRVLVHAGIVGAILT